MLSGTKSISGIRKTSVVKIILKIIILIIILKIIYYEINENFEKYFFPRDEFGY